MMDKIDANIFEFLKRRVASILIFGGLIVLFSYTIVIEVNNIPAYNNFAGWLWLTLFMPVIFGLYTYSHKIKDTKPRLRKFIRQICGLWFVVYPVMTIGLLIKWIVTLV